jgi:hypothetical protein
VTNEKTNWYSGGEAKRISRGVPDVRGAHVRLWDSGVRQALKRAAAAEGCDFPGLGPHSFQRANFTWRQEVGGSSIQASKIAGLSPIRMTGEYTKIQLPRQEDLTRRIQERLVSFGEKQPVLVR